MNKTIFIRRIDGKLSRPFHPFLGWRVSNFNEFVTILKKYFEEGTGYPGLVFRTKYKNIKVIFAGHQYEHGKEGKWCIFNTDTDNYPVNWINIREDFDTIFELFEDTEIIQNRVNAITKIVNVMGGITVKIK